MKITPVTLRNFPQAAQVYTASWRESHKDICSPEFVQNRDCDGYLRQRINGLYLLSDDGPAGVIRVYDGALSTLYVHPAKQGRGYGRTLLNFALKLDPNLKLTVLSTNEKAAGMYLRHGFRYTGKQWQLRDGLWEREMIRSAV
ncbi:MAG: GNAT family N-acetyltransferase [Oscillospiraceae bacterium]|nr:GNAT family N-acetyltransferase [Oscillospiraceae bacterium]